MSKPTKAQVLKLAVKKYKVSYIDPSTGNKKYKKVTAEELKALNKLVNLTME